MPRVLIPVTHPESAERAIRSLIGETGRPRPEVLLVAIVEPSTPGRIPLYLSPTRAAELAAEAGARWLGPLASMLDAAGIRNRSMVRLGRPIDIVGELAREQGIDRVLLPPRHGAFWDRREGNRLARQSHLEVTVVA